MNPWSKTITAPIKGCLITVGQLKYVKPQTLGGECRTSTTAVHPLESKVYENNTKKLVPNDYSAPCKTVQYSHNTQIEIGREGVGREGGGEREGLGKAERRL